MLNIRLHILSGGSLDIQLGVPKSELHYFLCIVIHLVNFIRY